MHVDHFQGLFLWLFLYWLLWRPLVENCFFVCFTPVGPRSSSSAGLQSHWAKWRVWAGPTQQPAQMAGTKRLNISKGGDFTVLPSSPSFHICPSVKQQIQYFCCRNVIESSGGNWHFLNSILKRMLWLTEFISWRIILKTRRIFNFSVYYHVSN